MMSGSKGILTPDTYGLLAQWTLFTMANAMHQNQPMIPAIQLIIIFQFMLEKLAYFIIGIEVKSQSFQESSCVRINHTSHYIAIPSYQLPHLKAFIAIAPPIETS